MKKLFVLLLIVGGISSAFVLKSADSKQIVTQQTGGIQFEDMSLQEAIKLSKETGKLIFIDAYTEWCGPCKKMAATSFKDENVAKTYNSKFINLKIEVEKSVDGPEIARMFGVKNYPTLLFVDGEGKLKKSVSGFQTADQLVALAKSI